MPKKTLKSSRSDLPTIKKVSEIENPRSYVFYGLPGTGKTTLASTFPEPILLIDMNDKGTDSVSDIKNLDVATIEHADQVEALFWELKHGKLDYETVILDTMTRYQQMLIESVTGDKDSGAKWGSMTRKQFGEVSATMKRTVDDYRDLPINKVFLAQQRAFNIEDDDSVSDDQLPPEIGPSLMPSIATHMNAAVNVIGQTFIRNRVEKKEIGKRIIKKDKMEYCLYVGPNPVRTTKIRKPRTVVLPSFLVDPTYEDLIEIIQGEV